MKAYITPAIVGLMNAKETRSLEMAWLGIDNGFESFGIYGDTIREESVM
jgi:hypothetical protein